MNKGKESRPGTQDIQTIERLRIDDEGLIFDPRTGTITTSNPVGVQILRSLREGRTLPEIKVDLAREYETEESVIEKDIFDFFSQLRNCGMVR